MKNYTIFIFIGIALVLPVTNHAVLAQDDSTEQRAVPISTEPTRDEESLDRAVTTFSEEDVALDNIGSSGEDGIKTEIEGSDNIGSSGEDGIVPSSNIGSSGEDGVRTESIQLDNLGSFRDDEGSDINQDPVRTGGAAELEARDDVSTEITGGKAEIDWKVEEGEKSPSFDSFFDIDVEIRGSESDSTERRRGDVIVEDLTVRGAFIKIDDVKGESSDRRSGSNSGSVQIVVDGRKARDASAPKILELRVRELDKSSTKQQSGGSAFAPDSFFDVFTDISDDGLALHAVAIAQKDEKIETISLNYSEVKVTYNSQGRLFGFIPVTLKQRVTVDTSSGETFGKVKVKFPWWSFLAKKDRPASNTQRTVQTEMLSMDLSSSAPVGDAGDRPTEEVAFYYNKIQAATLQIISDTLSAQ